MNLFADIITYISQTLGGLYIAVIILRFWLQLARADFYNPFSQAVVKLTNPLLIPLRRIIPGVFGIDIASLLLALMVQLAIGELNFFVVTYELYNPLSALLFGLLGTLKIATYLTFGLIIVMVVSSFVAPYSNHPVIMLSRQLIDPLAAPLRRLIPPAGGLDFSVLFISIGLVVVQKILDALT